jgi:hypothetical protein
MNEFDDLTEYEMRRAAYWAGVANASIFWLSIGFVLWLLLP